MSCPTTGYVSPSFDTSLASDIAGKVAASTATISANIGKVTGAISGLEDELRAFTFDSGFSFDTAGTAPVAPSIGRFEVTPGMPTAVTSPSSGVLVKPDAPSIEVQGFAESALSAPPTPGALGEFSKPAAPGGGITIKAPSTPDLSGAQAPGFTMPGGAPGALGATLPGMPDLRFDFGALLDIVGYNPPDIPDIPEMKAEFLLTDALDDYAWIIFPAVSAFNATWLDSAHTFFSATKNAGAVAGRVGALFEAAGSIWARAKVAALDSSVGTYVGNARNRYTDYLGVLEANFDLRTNVAAKSAALEKIATAMTVEAAVKALELEHTIALLGQKLDVAVSGMDRFVEVRRAETARLRAELEAMKARYIAQGIQAEVFEQKVKTSGAIVAANRAAASGAATAAEAAGALIEVDEATVGAVRAKIDAAQAEVQALKAKEIKAELNAAVFKGEVQKWRATLAAASAEVSAGKAALGVVSAQNQALSQQVAAINSSGFARVAAAQLSVAKAQAAGAHIKTQAMTAAAEIQKDTTANQISLVEARIGYLGAATAASAPMARNEAVASINEAIARSNQAVATTTGDANTGVRQAAQSQATASTAATDIAFRYNSELAKAFAALNAGKLAGYRISTSKRMTGDMGVRFNMSARKDKSYSGAVSQADDCETITTHEQSV